MGAKIKCKKCGTIAEGDRRGSLISCECGACYIDETEYYCRVGGDPKYISWVSDTGEETPVLTEVKEETPKYERPSKENYYLNIAEEVSERSTCLRRKYGAIIVKNDEITACGYNGAPRGLLSCLDKGHCERENSERGMDYSICPSVHAEMNAIISASRKDMIGADIYIVGKEIPIDKDLPESYVENPAPCSLCKRMIINSGIKSVFVRTSLNTYEVYGTNQWTALDIVGGY